MTHETEQSMNSGKRSPTRRSWWSSLPKKVVLSSRAGDVVRSDALSALRLLKEDTADIVFLDPPFNLGKTYGRNGSRADRLAEEDYLKYMQGVIDECVRILKPGGALYLYHIPKWAIRFAALLSDELVFRHWIAVAMKNGFVRGPGLYPAHYALLYFTKGKPAVANRPKIEPATCPNCDEYIKDYGGYESLVEDGVNLSDVWDDLSPVRHPKYKNRSANELPLLLVKRVVEISGQAGGVLVDPFAGTGVAAIAARLGKMKFIVVDRELQNCKVIASRVGRVVKRRRSNTHSDL